MKRSNAFEWEDQPWFPSFLRQYMTDFLRFILQKGNLYQPVTSILMEGLQQTKSNAIVDLCSGAGGAVVSVQNNIKKATGKSVRFVLTDLFPNTDAYKLLQKQTGGNILFYKEPVDATCVPPALAGFRTLFSGFHHFDKKAAVRLLQNAVDAREGIAIFDGGSRSVWFIVLILLFHPIALLLFTPFIKPFSVKRLLFTYLMPVVPFCAIWDGVASVLRLYTPDEMLQLAKETKSSNCLYQWKAGIVTNRIGIRIAYLMGVPVVADECHH